MNILFKIHLNFLKACIIEMPKLLAKKVFYSSVNTQMSTKVLQWIGSHFLGFSLAVFCGFLSLGSVTFLWSNMLIICPQKHLRSMKHNPLLVLMSTLIL